MSTYLTTDWLNLRKGPAQEVIGVLPPGTVVESRPGTTENNWMPVKTFIGADLVEGFSFSLYLKETERPLQPPDATLAAPVVNLDTTNKTIRRSENNGRAYPLNEAGMPMAILTNIPHLQERVDRIHAVINWLDVEKSERYAPNSKSTYCNIYAFDVCHLLGAFIPRVWWTAESYAKILAGNIPEIIYEKSVVELNANAITNWFEDYGKLFGWKRIFEVDTMQQKVNEGKVGIIVAQRINLNRSGHIVAVVPELPSFPAQRSADRIISPLQSQAGAVNKKIFTSNNWWINPNKFRKFGLWVQEP